MVSELWPHRVKKIHEMFSVSFNMGCCMCGQGLPAWLENSRYCMNHLESALYPLLQDVDLQTRIYLWFMHDGAPPHYLVAVWEFLNSVFLKQDRMRWPNSMACSFPWFISLSFLCPGTRKDYCLCYGSRCLPGLGNVEHRMDLRLFACHLEFSSESGSHYPDVHCCA